jgi:acyl-CoA reductase-like NAD-dependent aldehyde dehydrogenase
VSPRIVEASQKKLEDARSKDATFLVGGPGFSTPSSLKPTIVLGVTREMDLYNEESFGPSAALFIARDDTHAIEIAHDNQYGLNAAIHTKNLHRALEIAKELETGQVHVNNMTPHDERKC